MLNRNVCSFPLSTSNVGRKGKGRGRSTSRDITRTLVWAAGLCVSKSIAQGFCVEIDTLGVTSPQPLWEVRSWKRGHLYHCIMV